MRTVKEHIRAACGKNLQATVDRFLMQYRNASHSSTHQPPSLRMIGRTLRCNLMSLKRKVWVRNRNKNQPWQAAEIVGKEGSCIVQAELEDGSTTRFHVEHTKPRVDPNETNHTDQSQRSGPRRRQSPDRYGVVKY